MLEVKAAYITTKFVLNLRGNINGPYVVYMYIWSLCCVCAHLRMSVHASTHIYQ